MNKRKKTIIVIAIIGVLVGAVGILALNGYFGGGGTIPEDTMTRGLVGYWSFDEGSGNIAYDISGAGNHGTLMNNPTWSDGKVSGGLTFDGTDDYINCGDNASLDIGTGDLSITAWIRTNIPTSTAYVVAKRYTALGNGYSLSVDTNGTPDHPHIILEKDLDKVLLNRFNVLERRCSSSIKSSWPEEMKIPVYVFQGVKK